MQMFILLHILDKVSQRYWQKFLDEGKDPHYHQQIIEVRLKIEKETIKKNLFSLTKEVEDTTF